MIATSIRSTLARPAGPSSVVYRALASLSSANNVQQWSIKSDFSRRRLRAAPAEKATEWSHTLDYASAESDFTASHQFSSNRTVSSADTWSESLSFASPEADFVSAPTTALGMTHIDEMLPEDKESVLAQSDPFKLSSASGEFLHAPETAFGVVHAREYESQPQHRHTDNNMAMFDLSNPILTVPESASGSISILEMLDDGLKAELRNYQASKESLPKTLSEAMEDERPIVITKAHAPFQVHDVNAAWEGLCGFTRNEAQNRSVGELLQGPGTDDKLAVDLIQRLQQTGFAAGTLTNYRKDGQAFTNYLQLGAVVHNENSAEADSSEVFFVGILHDVTEQR